MAKDYYIWRFLDQNITPNQAQEALEMAQNVNYKIFFRYATKRGDDAIAHIARCIKMAPSQLLKSDGSCIAIGARPKKLEKLSKKEIATLYIKAQNFPIKETIRTYLFKDPTPYLIEHPKIFLTIYNGASRNFRTSYLDRAYPPSFLIALSRYGGFGRFVNITTTSNEYNKTALSLFLIPKKYLRFQQAFQIAIKAIWMHYPHIARDLLKYASQRATSQREHDKSVFWLYLLTKETRYLHHLLTSPDLNIYTLYAHELAKKEFTNYRYLHQFHGELHLDLHDPFIWSDLWKNLTSLKSDYFSFQDTQALYAFLKERESRYHEHFFITPYENLCKNWKKRALIYAIARQESRFIPSSISRSYALGAMQFMPFLAKHYANRLHIAKFDLDMMFDENVSLSMAKVHLEYLRKRLHHPLLIAYAYNGGIGFVKREIVQRGIFENGEFQPFLGMELVPYPESREYGKRVLSNYYIYRKIFHAPFSLTQCFENLIRLSRRLRERK